MILGALFTLALQATDVVAETLAMRSRGSPRGPVIANIDPANATLLKTYNHWVKVKAANGRIGFVDKDDWQTRTQAAARPTNDKALALRNRGGLSGAVIGQVDPSNAQVIQTYNHWVKVKTANGKVGFVDKSDWEDATEAQAGAPKTRCAACDSIRASLTRVTTTTVAAANIPVRAFGKLFIDIRGTTMHVFENGKLKYSWPIGTGGKRGYEAYATNGKILSVPEAPHENYRSKEFNATLRYAIRLENVRGIFIHAGNTLGKGVSHGCIRLHPENAKALYQMVNAVGYKNVTFRAA